LAVSCFCGVLGTIWPVVELASANAVWGAVLTNPFYAMGLFDRPEQVPSTAVFFDFAFTPIFCY
jgi:cytochrome c-type biogenesis protein CcmF